MTTLRDRLYQLYGERADLIEVRHDSGDIKVLGYAAALAEQHQVPMVQSGGASSRIFSRGYKYVFGTLPPARRASRSPTAPPFLPAR